MKITLVPSSVSGILGDPNQFATSILVNDTIAIDAGSLGFYLTPDDQAKVRHLLVSHTHMDHVATLPIFLENVFTGSGSGPTLYASETTWSSLRSDLFNDRVWPDFIKMSETFMKATPFLQCQTIESGSVLELDGLKITVVGVDHLVPTLGFILEDDHSTVVIPSDTGPTQAVWDLAKTKPNLKAVFLEVCFPNNMIGLAKSARHFVPSTFGEEMKKLNDGSRHVPFHAVHIKSRFREKVVAELNELNDPDLHIARFGVPYVF